MIANKSFEKMEKFKRLGTGATNQISPSSSAEDMNAWKYNSIPSIHLHSVVLS